MKKSFKKQSVPQLQKHIRETAQHTENIFLTSHSKARMKTRHLVCRMERYVCGRNLEVCVALDDDDPTLIVVTVF